jgi:hypothetical protein
MNNPPENIGEFSGRFGDAADVQVTSLYGIHEGSGISADDYASFCEELGLPLEAVEPDRHLWKCCRHNVSKR